MESTDPVDPSPNLRGRCAEMDAIGQFLSAKARGGLLMLTAEPGGGLSTLLRWSGSRASGYQVLSTDCWDPGRQPVRLPALSALLRLLVPGTQLAPTDVAQTAIQVVESLRARALGGRMLVLLDDVRRQDQADLELLSFVGRQVADDGVRLLAAVTQEIAPGQIAHPGSLPVAPLARDHARCMLREHHPDLSEAMADHVLTQAAGNPLALRELPTTLTVAQRATASPHTVPPLMTPSLLRRWAPYLDGLPPATLDLLLLAALHRQPALHSLSRAGGTQEFLSRLAPAESAGVVKVSTEGLLTFTHPLLALCVIAQAPAPQRARAYECWAASGTDESHDLVWHRGHAVARLDESLALRLRTAAERAEHEGDYLQSQALLVRWADLSSDGTEAGTRLVQAAYLASRAGQRQLAQTLLRRARDSDPRSAHWLRTAMVSSVLRLGEEGLEPALRILARAIAQDTDPTPETTRPAALRLWWLLTTLSGDPRWWRRFERGLSQSPEPLPADLKLAGVVARRGLGETADLAIADEVIGALGAHSSQEEVMVVAHSARVLNRLDDCRSVLRTHQPRPGSVDLLGLDTRALLAICHLTSGEWAAAEKLLSAPESVPGQPGTFLGVLHAILMALRDQDQDAEVAEQLLRDAQAWAEPLGITVAVWVAAWARSLVAANRADTAGVYRSLEPFRQRGTIPLYVGLPVRILLDLVESSVRTGHRDEAALLVRRMRAARVGDLSRHQEVVLQACEAVVTTDPKSARHRFESTLAGAADDLHPFDIARITLLFGEQQRAARRPEQARALLATARDTFAWLGSTAWAQRAATELRAAGRSEQHTRARPGRAELSPQELRIAELAAQGLTNKEIGSRLQMSPRTVGNYLHRIFPLLGITGRAGLGPALEARAPHSPQTQEPRTPA